MKLCFVCETPFQVLNCLNYIMHQDEFSNVQADFYIGKRFHGSVELAQRLKNLDGVHQVYTYSMEKRNVSLPARLKAIFAARQFVADCVDGPFDLAVLDYDYVHLSFFGPMTNTMVFVNKRAKVRYFEDGLGTYVGTSATTGFSLLRKTLYTLAGTDHRRLFKPEALFVNNKTLCKSKVTNDVRQLPSLANADTSFLDKLFYVFDYKANPIYSQKKCIYLSRPNDANKPEIDVMDRKVEEALAAFSDDFVLRMHPRQKDFRVGTMLPDTMRTSWELMCIDQITEEHVLVGWFSTAQVIPKFILDKEPWLVFYYPIYQKNAETAEAEYESFDRMIEELKKSYRNPEKVIMVDSVDGIADALNTIVRGA